MEAEVRGDACCFILSPQRCLFSDGRRRTDTGERRGTRLQHRLFFAFKMFEFILQLYLNSSPNDPRVSVLVLYLLLSIIGKLCRRKEKKKMSLTKSYSLYLLFVLPVQKRIQRRAKTHVLLPVTSSPCNASARVSRMIF